MIKLTPSGTVRARMGHTSDRVADVLMSIFEQVAIEHQLDPSLVIMSLELARLERGLSLGERVALSALILVSLLSLQEGSTRISIDRHPEGSLAERVTRVAEHARKAAAVLDEQAAGICAALEPGAVLDALGGLLDGSRGRTLIAHSDDGTFKPLVLDRGYLYHQRVLECEADLIKRLERRLSGIDAAAARPEVGDALGQVLAAMPLLSSGKSMILTEEQQYAILTALHLPLTVISGGPGTGKTSIVVSLLRVAIRAGVPIHDIALAAPTGKAANRLGESVRGQLQGLEPLLEEDERLLTQLPEPTTLHRLLNYSPRFRRYRFHELNPLPGKLIVVDEASMIDLFLMTQLLSAVAEGARLVLIGDADQLPSVETGAIFRDLVPRRTSTSTPWASMVVGNLKPRTSTEPTARCAVRLVRSFRMRATDPGGRNVLSVAQWINTGGILGELFGDYGMVRVADGVEDLIWTGVSIIPDVTALGRFLMSWYKRWVATLPLPHPGRALLMQDGALTDDSVATLDTLFAHWRQARLLCITRVLPTGTENINGHLHRRYLERQGLPPLEEMAAGEPVMMVRNDYDAGLFNGDQGIILRVSTDPDDLSGIKKAIFPTRTGYRVFDLPRVAHTLELCYAMTVHKSQGSEFEHVGIVLPSRDMSLLSKEILYTAITRASRSVTFLGTREQVTGGAARGVLRSSGVREGLQWGGR